MQADLGELGRLSYWGGLYTKPLCTKTGKLAECWEGGYEPFYTLQQEKEILSKAIANPGIPFTMTCVGQQYTSRSEEYCNPNTDKRRQALAGFVEVQHRQKDGVWLQQVQSLPFSCLRSMMIVWGRCKRGGGWCTFKPCKAFQRLAPGPHAPPPTWC